MDAATAGSLLSKVNAVTNRGARITTTGTADYTATMTGWHLVRAQGAGGGGETVAVGGYIGGQAGMFVEMKHWLVAGANYSRTVGVGGAGGNPAAAGGDTTFTGPNVTQTAKGGSGGANGSAARYDASPANGSAALNQLGGVIGGAMGGNTTSPNGGYCGQFLGGVSTASGGGGGASVFASGGEPNTAGTLGSGGGAGTTAGAGGNGVIEIEFIGTN